MQQARILYSFLVAPGIEGATKRFIEDGWRADELRPIVADGPTLDTALDKTVTETTKI